MEHKVWDIKSLIHPNKEEKKENLTATPIK